jgi:ABC-type transport system involved in multi-copper enzyme maturation permease subunit
MAIRLGLGPVFLFESLRGARRWQVYAGRALFVLALLAGMIFVWVDRDGTPLAAAPRTRTPSLQRLAQVGEGFFYALTGIQVALVLLVAPAFTAGSICADRQRGTLLHVLATDLSDSEIVLGKLGARLAPLVGLIACAFPVSALAALLGGIEFGAIGGAFVIALALAVLGCALALAVSVWATRTHEALLAVYSIETIWLVALPAWWGLSVRRAVMPPPAWFQKANPFALAFAPYSQPGLATAADYAAFAVCALLLASALVGVAIAKLRTVAIAPIVPRPAALRRRSRRLIGAWAGPSLDRNPVLWREWYHNRPSRLGRRLWIALLAISWFFAAWGTYDLLLIDSSPGPNGLTMGFVSQLFFGLLMLSAAGPTVLAEERLRGTLDVLLATPMSTRSVVVAKWLGLCRMLLLIAPVVLLTGIVLTVVTSNGRAITLPSSVVTPLTTGDRVAAAVLSMADFLATGAALASVGVALAVWVRRQGAAVAAGVTLYFVMTVGWMVVGSFLMNRFGLWSSESRWLANGVMAFSPLYGPICALDALTNLSGIGRERTLIASGVVVLLKAGFAGLLLGLTIKTFDRRLGRTPEVRVGASPQRALPSPWSLPGWAGAFRFL